MTDNFENKVAVDWPVVNDSEAWLVDVFPGPGFAEQARWDLASGGRSMRKREKLPCGFCVASR